MNNKTDNKTVTPPGTYRPKLAFFHATPKGTGCAATMELHPATILFLCLRCFGFVFSLIIFACCFFLFG